MSQQKPPCNTLAARWGWTSTTIDCPHEELSGWRRVMVHPELKLCEVGLNCPAAARCPYAYTAADVMPCPTCQGKPNVDQEPYCCTTCDVFGIARKETR